METYLNEKVSKNKHKFPRNITCLQYSRFTKQPVAPWSQNCSSICMREEKTKKESNSCSEFFHKDRTSWLHNECFTPQYIRLTSYKILLFYMQNYRFLNSTNWWPNKARKQSIKQFEEYLYSLQILHNPL